MSPPSETAWHNLPTMFFEQVDRFGDRPFLWSKRSDGWQSMSWGDTAARVIPLARGLISLGIEPGDRVVLVSENRPAWLVADVATMAAGAITVPAYTTNTVADHAHILSDSGARGALVSTAKLAKPLLEAAASTGTLEFVICLEAPDEVPDGIRIVLIDDLMRTGRARRENIIELAARWRRDDTACIIYTSGTGGAPKGVMLSHGAVLHNCINSLKALDGLDTSDLVFLSFLPLSHSYEHTAGQFLPIAAGSEIYYAEGIEHLAANMTEVRPTVMTAVPRLYESMHQRITLGVRKTGGLKETLFMAALDLGRRRQEDPASLSLLDRLKDRVVDRLVRDKVRARFGGRLKALVSGGAPLNPEIGMFFTALGLRILQGYGQTEAAPVITVNRPEHPKLHSVGPPIPNTEVRIADDGEILVRGELVMQGYWDRPDETAETLKDGWLHTGDVGHFDADGHLVITDRKKDIIVNSGGDNLSPQRVEGRLTVEPEIAQAMVYGDKRPHLVAALVPDPDWLKGWAREHGKPTDLAALADDKQLHAALSDALDRVNAKLNNIERVRRFLIAEAPFSIENDMLTPTMKIRRHKIRETYGERLERLYGG